MFERLSGKPVRLQLDCLQYSALDAAASPALKAFSVYVRNVMKILEQSPCGSALLGRAKSSGLSVGLDPLLEPNNCFFYAEQNHFDLGFQPDLLQKTQKGVSRYLACFTGGLRRSWHCTGGFQKTVWRQKPEDALRAYRCMEADAEAAVFLVAWELRAVGAGFFWRYLLSGDNGDIGVVFERIAAEGPEHQFNGRALRAAFDQWFADRTRVAAADRQALEIIDMALVRGRGERLPLSGFKGEDLQVLGTLPGGKNYLSGCLFTGSRYDGLDDPFNQIHLQHICRDIAQSLEKNDYQ